MKYTSFTLIPLLALTLVATACSQKPDKDVQASETLAEEEAEEEMVLPEPEGPHPYLSIADSVFMGTVTDEAPVKTVTIEMSNTGDETLCVTRAVPDCECTSVVINDTVLAPGAKGTIEATVDLTKYGKGRIENQFFLVNNNLSHHYVTVTLICDKE